MGAGFEEREAGRSEEEAEPASELVEAVKTPQEQLAEEVNTCFAKGKCQRLGKRFDEVAEQLGIEVNTLIDEVFAIAKGKKAEQTEVLTSTSLCQE